MQFKISEQNALLKSLLTKGTGGRKERVPEEEIIFKNEFQAI